MTMESNNEEPKCIALLGLPYDCYRRIFSALEPFALLQLSQTCKHFHEFLSDKNIWKEALRELCRRDHVFEPSFPIEEMGLGDLQRASVGPTVWKNKVHRHAALGMDSPLPFVERTFERDYEPGLRRGILFDYVKFIPGGRYLISASEKFITLWDLGPSVPALRLGETPRILDTFSTEGTGWRIMGMSHILIQSRYVRFGVSVCDYWRALTTYQLYEIGPLPENPSIREIWKPTVPGNTLAFIRASIGFQLEAWRYVAISRPDFWILCDTSRDYFCWVKLELPEKNPHEYFMAQIVNGHLFMVEGRKMCLWKIEDLQWSLEEDESSESSAIIPADITFELFDNLPIYFRASSAGPPKWYLQSQLSYCLDLATPKIETSDSSGSKSKYISSVTFERWTFDLSTHPSNARMMKSHQYVHSLATPFLHSKRGFNHSAGLGIGPLTYSSNRLFASLLSAGDGWSFEGTSGRGFFAVVSAPFYDNPDSGSEWAVAYLPDLPHWDQAMGTSLDPHSGLLAYACHENPGDNPIGKIHILDFQRLESD